MSRSLRAGQLISITNRTSPPPTHTHSRGPAIEVPVWGHRSQVILIYFFWPLDNCLSPGNLFNLCTLDHMMQRHTQSGPAQNLFGGLAPEHNFLQLAEISRWGSVQSFLICKRHSYTGLYLFVYLLATYCHSGPPHFSCLDFTPSALFVWGNFLPQGW